MLVPRRVYTTYYSGPNINSCLSRKHMTGLCLDLLKHVSHMVVVHCDYL